ncbi:MAG: hypothetical protein A2289_22325 [Deltaproteobacteria bacterium RIFOXYA12_FULL_58_15]|nr:MAG: hypothetical protein A2289_22325 [Deltaproteobacteria bacterium RIFOXYA12_FULL_58_15]OGR07404.1 MAG: hypothetical protein A2341_26320 [Deltaproteobacteria bacterium RIFOXYB12_FULL_58_9]
MLALDAGQYPKKQPLRAILLLIGLAPAPGSRRISLERELGEWLGSGILLGVEFPMNRRRLFVCALAVGVL